MKKNIEGIQKKYPTPYIIFSTREPKVLYSGETLKPLKQKLFEFSANKRLSPEILEWKEREKEFLEIQEITGIVVPNHLYFYTTWLDSLESDVIVFSGTSKVFQHKKTLEERAQEKQQQEEWWNTLEERGRVNRLRLEQGLPHRRREKRS